MLHVHFLNLMTLSRIDIYTFVFTSNHQFTPHKKLHTSANNTDRPKPSKITQNPPPPLYLRVCLLFIRKPSYMTWQSDSKHKNWCPVYPRKDETASAANADRSLSSVLRDAATLPALGVDRASRSFLVAFLNMFVLVLGMILKGEGAEGAGIALDLRFVPLMEP